MRPIIMMAGGTGFAPLKGIIEHTFHIGSKRPIHLFWGARPAVTSIWMIYPPNGLLSMTIFSSPRFCPKPNPERPHRLGARSGAGVDYPDMSMFELYMSGPLSWCLPASMPSPLPGCCRIIYVLRRIRWAKTTRINRNCRKMCRGCYPVVLRRLPAHHVREQRLQARFSQQHGLRKIVTGSS